MKRILSLALAFSLVLAFASTVFAAPAPLVGDIKLDTANPTYQQPVTFSTTVTGKMKGYQYPMVYVQCFQPGNPLAYSPEGGVYGQLDYPYAQFILGGGSSVWVLSGGGDAECEATLYIYPGLHNDSIIFLDRTTFHANG